MKKYIAAILLAFGLINSSYAQEKAVQTEMQQAEKTVVLHIPEMYCQLCVLLG